MIIWWLFNFNYLMIAWSSTLMIVWAMIVWWLYGDFFIIIICDFLISAPPPGWLVWFFLISLHMEQWHILRMAAFSLPILQPVRSIEASLLPAAEATLHLQQQSCLLWCFWLAKRSALLHQHHFSVRGSGPSHQAKSDSIHIIFYSCWNKAC